MWRIMSGIAVSVGVLGAASPSYATSVPQRSMSAVMKNSQAAVLATVIDVDAYAVREDGREPYTRVSFRVKETLFGEVGEEELSYEIPGGFDPNGDFLLVEGSPVFLEGRTYVLFLRHGPWYLTPVTNWWHSVFELRELGDRRVLLSQEGRFVEAVEPAGFAVGPEVFPDALDEHLRAVGDAQAPFTSHERSAAEIEKALAQALDAEEALDELRALLKETLASLLEDPDFSERNFDLRLLPAALDGAIPTTPAAELPSRELSPTLQNSPRGALLDAAPVDAEVAR